MNIRQRLAQFAQYQRTMRELSALDQRQLNDLGITKGDIKNIARGALVRLGVQADNRLEMKASIRAPFVFCGRYS